MSSDSEPGALRGTRGAVTEREVSRRSGRASDETARVELDSVAVEEPLEIRVAGDTLAITMRTPGDDRFLAVGFLYAEGVIAGLEDVGTVAHCGRPSDEGYGNTIDVSPGPGRCLDASALDGTRRGTLTTASCGICGRRSIDDLIQRIGPLQDERRISSSVLHGAPTVLASAQQFFTATGGAHAAAALDAGGTSIAFAEDVGRHNAVDKVVGKLLYEGQLEDALVLVVSGRVSFEIVQKAAAARIPIIAAVSAPTSLAIDLASKAAMTLTAFVRDGRMNVYTGAHRLD